MSGGTPLYSIKAGQLYCGRAGWGCDEIKALGIWVFRREIIVEQPGLGGRIKRPLQKGGVHAFVDVTLEHHYDEGTTSCRGAVFGFFRLISARRDAETRSIRTS